LFSSRPPGLEADLLLEPPAHPLPGARPRALMQRFAWLAAGRLAALEDPGGVADLRASLRVECSAAGLDGWNGCPEVKNFAGRARS
jgi:DNA repair protein MmcB-like